MNVLKKNRVYHITKLLAVATGFFALMSCAPVKLPEANQYQMSSYSAKKLVAKSGHHTLLVTTPEAVAAYQTAEMLYINKQYQLEAFAKNSWVEPPASMLYPLLVQSIQHSGFFAAVSSSAYTQSSDYRLDTQVLHLEQNFLKKPSVLEFSVKVVFTRLRDNKIIASRIFNERIPCSTDTPYGGVIAANKASLIVTEKITGFVVASTK